MADGDRSTERKDWRDIDSALIEEATKVHPDFYRMEQLVNEGADVNAIGCGGEENVLSEVIFGLNADEYNGGEVPKEDSLPAVIDFFLRHGFDPSRDEGRAGAKCLVNLTWSRCPASKIPSMKLLLDAGCRDIPALDDERESDSSKPISCIGDEESYLTFGGDLELANTFAALYEILCAKASGRAYSGIERYDAAYGGILKRVFVSRPEEGAPVFDLDEPTSRHTNCFRGNLYLELDKGWLFSRCASDVVFDTERPMGSMVDISDSFGLIIGAALADVGLSQAVVRSGLTSYSQEIIHYNFDNCISLTTQTNFGEVMGAETVAYYRLSRRK